MLLYIWNFIHAKQQLENAQTLQFRIEHLLFTYCLFFLCLDCYQCTIQYLHDCLNTMITKT